MIGKASRCWSDRCAASIVCRSRRRTPLDANSIPRIRLFVIDRSAYGVLPACHVSLHHEHDDDCVCVSLLILRFKRTWWQVQTLKHSKCGPPRLPLRFALRCPTRGRRVQPLIRPALVVGACCSVEPEPSATHSVASAQLDREADTFARRDSINYWNGVFAVVSICVG